ncbi:DUF4169 family protein [Tardiphaga sp. vice352]|uniref:DUF4169 family protein n=1 Tax=unclassified Tardiphaga TaxID=2631404 RepID=UPI00116581AF|nr:MULTISPECIES: DUF4169 family protein [unclassified Tardiphaga]MBC7582365.1 DUF4169 family protein [Tardiphaga sp.]QDM16317.1 DUF4169 family protein [Tardiphaga sp. vice278]QDM21341.1 DUF4169 family protein [Tardiphaga sp. vice154]QDM26526.1 DUF4169 family protein [Tardiphaga sp. vice304]QDM31593.1 DUF4169 family protein [Tardiphaga sp. vice352]
MGDLINLNRFKKRAERDDAARQAEINRARFGRSRAERVLEEKRTIRAENMLDQHQINGEDAS